jgi:hypothetical protein
MTRQEIEHLVRVAREALTFLSNEAAGNALNGPQDDIALARQLLIALAPFASVPKYQDVKEWSHAEHQ